MTDGRFRDSTKVRPMTQLERERRVLFWAFCWCVGTAGGFIVATLR